MLVENHGQRILDTVISTTQDHNHLVTLKTHLPVDSGFNSVKEASHIVTSIFSLMHHYTQSESGLLVQGPVSLPLGLFS